MNDRRLTFFSFVAILSSIRQPSSGPLPPIAVNALSSGKCQGRRFQYTPTRSRVPDSTFRTNGGVTIGYTTDKSRRSTSTLPMATSSSDLKTTKTIPKNKTLTKKAPETKKESEASTKKDEKKPKGISNNVVSRLARAAKEAAEAKRKKKTENTSTNSNTSGRTGYSENDSEFEDETYFFEDDDDTNENQSGLSSITKLSSVIDQELLRPHHGYKPARETDSIRLLLEHNNDQKQSSGRPATNKSIISSSSSTRTSSSSNLKQNGIIADKDLTPKDVAIVFGRPLSDGEITIEYAARLVSLAKAMKFEGYKPSLVCFCGPSSPPLASGTTANTATKTHRSVPSVGVEFFRHLCSVNDISLEGTDLCRVPSLSSTRKNKSQQDKYDDSFLGSFSSSSSFSSSWSIFSLSPVVKKLLGKHYFEKWLEESEAYESDMDEYGMTRQEPRKKIHIHWKLFSTEYHLCNLNDIHIRSPRQSPLARLMHDLEQAVNSEDYRRGIVQTTWSFHYSIYPYVVSSNKEKLKEAFLGKCYLMAQSLVPLLVNLKGVAENVSLASCRRIPLALIDSENSHHYCFATL